MYADQLHIWWRAFHARRECVAQRAGDRRLLDEFRTHLPRLSVRGAPDHARLASTLGQRVAHERHRGMNREVPEAGQVPNRMWQLLALTIVIFVTTAPHAVQQHRKP